MEKKKALPIGTDDFKKLMEKECYYVDKSLIIKEILDMKSEVILFTRPRRFGKTLIQSMIRTFFEKEIAVFGKNKGQVIDNRSYFQGLKIMEAGEAYTSRMGQYPVIFLSLKSAKQPHYEMSYKSLMNEISKEFERHAYILKDSEMTDKNRKKYMDLMNETASEIEYAKSLQFLSECLYQYFGKKAIILIDEYDVPLENAYSRGFYDKMISFIRSLFESALKTNDSMEFGVITGCLRISKESIFTGLNNLRIISILSPDYGEYFGFTPAEVREICAYLMA